MLKTRSGCWSLTSIVLAFVVSLPLHAQGGNEEYFPPEVDSSLMISGFRAGHPDLDFRKRGMDAFNKRHYVAARTAFLRAARYGDKPSQAMLGEIHWKGLGIQRDPVLGYVWMFLAAERGYYDFRAWSEAYWHEMSIEQRQQAQERGPAIVAAFGDAVAVPRLEQAMRRELQRGTGSMLDSSGQSLMVLSYEGGSPKGVDPQRFYAAQYWRPAEYRQLQDRLWKAPLQKRVDVGPLEDVSAPVRGTPPER